MSTITTDAPTPPAFGAPDPARRSGTAAGTVAREDRVESLWSDALVFAGRNLQHVRQIPEKLTDVTLQPLMFVLLFAFVFGGAIAVDGGNYREYLLGGILIQTIAFGLTRPATAIASDLTEGVIDRFRALPTRKAAYVFGHYLAEMAGAMLSLVVLFITGFIVGWRPHTAPLSVLAGVLLLLAFATAMVWVGTWIGLVVRAPDAVMGVAFMVVFPLTFLSNAFVPIESLPTALQWVASWNPISALVAAVRELFGNSGTPLPDPAWPLANPVLASVITIVVVLAVSVPAALHRFQTRTSD